MQKTFPGDAFIPSADLTAALAGTSGAPGATNKFVTNADARNADARTPLPHHTSHEPGGSDALAGIAPSPHHATHEPGGSDPLAVDAAAGVGSLRTLGAGTVQACPGNDSRLSDDRTPLVHGSAKHTGIIGTWAQIDKTVSDLGNLTTKSHTSLTDIGTNTHPAIDTHLAAASPHSGHEVKTSKGGANGYCELDAGTKVPAARLWGAGEDASKFMRGDRLLAMPTWAQIDKTVSNLGDLTTKSHTSLTDKGVTTHADIDTFIQNSLNYINYSAISIVVGWSSFYYKDIFYKKIGSFLFVSFYLHGVCNGTTASFTLPFNVNAPGFHQGIIRVEDNYNWLAAPGLFSITQGSNVVNLYKDCAMGAFTNAGQKGMAGQFHCEVSS